MTNVQSPYRVHVYSKDRSVKNTDLSERTVLDEVTRLHREWDRETDNYAQYSDRERRRGFADDLKDRDAVYVLVEDRTTRSMVGYGQMVNEAEGPLLANAYVLQGYRRRGILGAITRTIIDTARTKGYETLTAEPASEGSARKVFSDNGFRFVRFDGSDVVLRLDLRRGPGEGNGPTPGMPPRSRR